MAGRRIPDKEAVNKQIVLLLSSGCYIETACAAVGISTDTFNRWEKADAEFAAQTSRAKPNSWIADLAAMRQAAIAGDWRAAAEHLDRTGSPYRKSQDGTLTVHHSGTVSHRDLSRFTDSEIDMLAAIADRVTGGPDDGA